MNSTLATLLILVAIDALTPCSNAWGEGVPKMTNPATPIHGVESRILVEQWRAGGDADEVFFGSVAGIVSDAAGNIYVLDGQQSCVQVYAPDGSWLRTIGRRGEGPGEVDGPDGILLDQRGRVCLFQAPMGRIVRLNSDGTPAGSLAYRSDDGRDGAVTILLGGETVRDRQILAGMHLTFSNDGRSTRYYFLALCDAEGARVRPLLEKSEHLDYSDFRMDEASRDFPWSRWTTDDNGNIYVVPARNEYAIRVYGHDGTLARVIMRDYRSLPRDERLRQRAILVTKGVAKYHRTPLRGLTVEETEPDVKGIWTVATGDIYVRTSRGDEERPDGCYTVLDQFTREGDFVRQIALSSEADPLRDSMTILRDGRVVMTYNALDAWLTQQSVDQGDMQEAAEEPLEIVIYRLEE